MNIRTRLIWAMVVISLVPLAVLAFSSNLALDEMIAKAGQEAQDALEKEGRQSILQVANAVAGQMRLYLYLHPELDLTDMDAVQRDLGLADIAVQSVGVTGYTAVFDSQGITRFHAQPENIGLDMSTLAEELPDFWGIFEAALDGSPSEGYYEWIDSDGSVRQKFMVIVPVEGTELRVAATTYIDEFAQPVEELSQRLNKAAGGVRLRLLGIGALGVIFAAGMALFFGIRLTSPLRDMAESAEQVAQGDWEAIRVLPERTELGALSRSLYAMTNQLRTTQMNLERDVESRTSELSRRTGQLEAAAEVAREAAAIRNLDELLTQVTLLIFERFKFYHVGIFLVDEARKYVILRAANSEGGKRMLQRGYQLRLGQEGIVGWVANAGRPRVAFDVGADRQYFKNPDLPQTRSEAALPLRIRERVIGVLDVQSTESSAFVPEDIGVLQIMADQIALAVENTRLFEETQQTIQAMNRLYGQQTQEAWQKYLSEHPVAFRYTR
ncbi:MAG: GAF domain-containing protein, partial [Anaerolineales bacterium]|nr:GAF domain-containing protein [Anaerolineales bacterium]